MTDHLLWKNDIENRFSPTSLTDALTGAIYIATSVISGVTTNSGVHMSQWDAYKDLRERLLNGDTTLLPKSTTTQRDALSGIVDGTVILNTTTGKEEICNSSSWASVSGSTTMSDVAYGSMFQHNTSGDAMETTNKVWITASQGVVDANGLITFVSDDTNGDYLLVGTGGAGDYQIIVTCDVTNAGNNETTMAVHINGSDATDIEDEEDTNSTKPRTLAAHGIHALSEGDKIAIHMVSSTPADVVKTYDCHVTIQRLS